jgi:Arm DNA-binding domain
MPRIRLTKSAIDSLPASKSDVVYWDAGCPGFGVKVTPKGRKVFIVLYRTAGAGSKLRKYTIGPYGRVTLHQARVAAQKVFAAKLEGRDPAAEKRAARRRIVADRVEDLLETFIAQRLSQNRSGGEIARLLRRELGKTWAGRSIHEISKRDVVEVVTAIARRSCGGAWAEPSSTNPLPKACHCRRRRSLATECWTTMSLRTSSLPLEKSVELTAGSWSFWRSPDSGAKRSPVYGGKS